MANGLHHKNILAFYGVIIASAFSPSVAIVSSTKLLLHSQCSVLNSVMLTR